MERIHCLSSSIIAQAPPLFWHNYAKMNLIYVPTYKVFEQTDDVTLNPDKSGRWAWLMQLKCMTCHGLKSTFALLGYSAAFTIWLNYLVIA